MTSNETDAGRHAEALDGAIGGLAAAAEGIAGRLSVPPPRNRAGLEDALRAVQGQVTRAQPLLAEIQRAQGEATRRAGEERPGGRLPQIWYEIGAKAGLFRTALNRWPEVESLVRAQIAEPRRKLVPRGWPNPMAATQTRIGDGIFERLHGILPLGQHAGAVAAGARADTGLPQSAFLALAHAAYRVCLARGLTETTFLDVGCGVGMKMVSAAAFFDRVAGIEIDPGYAARAEAFVEAADLPVARVVRGDARDFEHYRDFDVIYLYRPLGEPERMADLERRIGAALRHGQLVIGPYDGLAARHREAGLRPLAPGLFVAGLTGAEAADLRRRAEHVGPAVRPPSDPLTSVWTPILRASQAMGFDLPRN